MRKSGLLLLKSINTIIKNVSLKINPGEYVGIVGASGCGKSTLVKLLVGFVKPSSGTVSFDGVDINQYDLRLLRRQFGVVLQNVQIKSFCRNCFG